MWPNRVSASSTVRRDFSTRGKNFCERARPLLFFLDSDLNVLELAILLIQQLRPCQFN